MFLLLLLWSHLQHVFINTEFSSTSQYKHILSLTHLGLVMSFAIMDTVNIGSGDGLSLIRHQTRPEVMLIHYRMDLWEEFVENLIKIKIFSVEKIHLAMLSSECWPFYLCISRETRWGRVTHICISKLTTIGSDNGLSPGRRQAIIWTNAGMLLIGPLGIKFSEILIEINTFSFSKMHLKMSSAKWLLFHLGLDQLIICISGFITQQLLPHLIIIWCGL